MKLDEKQRKDVLRALREKLPKALVCSACGGKKWIIGDKVFQMPEHGLPMRVGGPVVPVIPATCTNCGNTLLFNAIVLGVVQPYRAEVKSE